MAIADTFDSDYPYRPYSIPGMNDAYTSLPPIGDDTQWGKKDWLEEVVRKQLQEGYDFRFEDAITRDYMRGLDYLDALEAGDMETANAIASMFEAREFDDDEELQEPNFTYERNEDGKLEAIPIPGANEDQNWIRDVGDWIYDKAEGVGDWIYNDASNEIPYYFNEAKDAIGNTEWKKVIANSVLGTPEMLLDLSTVGPQLGIDIGQALNTGNLDEIGTFFKNEPFYKYDEDKTDAGYLDEIGSGILSIPAFRYLYNRSPEFAKTIARNWMPYMTGLATDFGSDLKNYYRQQGKKIKLKKNQMAKAGNMLKNMLWSPNTGRALAQTAGTGGLSAFLSTLFYSPPLGAEEEYEGVYAKKPKFEFTYDPNVNMNNINTGLIQDSDPVIFDSYMQDKLDNFEPRTTAPGPRPNYQGL